MPDTDFILIVAPGKEPVRKSPTGTDTKAVLKLLDECMERENAADEMRLVCMIDEYGEFDVWGEKKFRLMFAESN